ncbi:ABC transporter ATP-binding protein [Kineococcus rhizosphaerae]|uniref:Putative ABC transport system ATP-binding protein n=1 Tax=Kineococcus rhizosphaerae TaxID=559628 RepID=A0A2T0R2R1_9ACTN|nr:ABC transporter ATP-binding protein [Kineococcus rhizosphaerae]PRY14098.1 putative ABC transport system ATP-binding protein [Kineococcus rhizosphaerae]
MSTSPDEPTVPRPTPPPAVAPAPLLRARDLVKTHPGPDGTPVPVLRGISMEVAAGELVAVVGPSGSGKSTLLHCLSGLDRPSSGTVEIAGTELGGLSRGALAKLRRERVGFVFQAYNLISSLTAWDNVALPARLARRTVRVQNVDRALARVGLADRARAKPSALSGGQQQRVAVARALAVDRDLVFADEPTGALDTAAGAQVLDLLRAAASGSRAVVLVTHDLQAAARADRVLVLRDGLLHAELRGAGPAELLAAVTAAAAPAAGAVGR